MLADEFIQLHIAISPYPADGILSAFVVIFIISFFNRLRLRAGRFPNALPNAKL
jgi:hypothetical protein